MSEASRAKFVAAIDAYTVFFLMDPLAFTAFDLGFHGRRPNRLDVENGDEPQIVAITVLALAYCVVLVVLWFRDCCVQIDGPVATTLQKGAHGLQTDDQTLIPRMRHDVVV